MREAIRTTKTTWHLLRTVMLASAVVASVKLLRSRASKDVSNLVALHKK